jgi:hypothetical protein
MRSCKLREVLSPAVASERDREGNDRDFSLCQQLATKDPWVRPNDVPGPRRHLT